MGSYRLEHRLIVSQSNITISFLTPGLLGCGYRQLSARPNNKYNKVVVRANAKEARHPLQRLVNKTGMIITNQRLFLIHSARRNRRERLNMVGALSLAIMLEIRFASASICV
jgi:hypothetical protein